VSAAVLSNYDDPVMLTACVAMAADNSKNTIKVTKEGVYFGTEVVSHFNKFVGDDKEKKSEVPMLYVVLLDNINRVSLDFQSRCLCLGLKRRFSDKYRNKSDQDEKEREDKRCRFRDNDVCRLLQRDRGFTISRSSYRYYGNLTILIARNIFMWYHNDDDQFPMDPEKLANENLSGFEEFLIHIASVRIVFVNSFFRSRGKVVGLRQGEGLDCPFHQNFYWQLGEVIDDHEDDDEILNEKEKKILMDRPLSQSDYGKPKDCLLNIDDGRRNQRKMLKYRLHGQGIKIKFNGAESFSMTFVNDIPNFIPDQKPFYFVNGDGALRVFHGVPAKIFVGR